MKKRILVLYPAILLTFICVSLNAHAAPISIGSLSSDDDGSTEIMTDTLNNLEWLRWDVLADLTRVQTLAAIGSGGAYEGWTIADSSYAFDFMEALVGVGIGCSEGTTGWQNCNSMTIGTGDFAKLVGDNFDPDGVYDIAHFNNTNGGSYAVGLIGLTNSGGSQGRTVFTQSWNTIASSDTYGHVEPGYTGTAWLLYRDPAASSGGASVPEPSTYLLFSSGLVCMVWYRRRQAKA